jgi:hypothetical protein
MRRSTTPWRRGDSAEAQSGLDVEEVQLLRSHADVQYVTFGDSPSRVESHHDVLALDGAVGIGIDEGPVGEGVGAEFLDDVHQDSQALVFADEFQRFGAETDRDRRAPRLVLAHRDGLPCDAHTALDVAPAEVHRWRPMNRRRHVQRTVIEIAGDSHCWSTPLEDGDTVSIASAST